MEAVIEYSIEEIDTLAIYLTGGIKEFYRAMVVSLTKNATACQCGSRGGAFHYRYSPK